MNFRKAFVLVPFVALFLIYSGCQASSAASVLFEKAKFTMETKGDMEGAIKLFDELITKYPEERKYAAKSQLYIGLCYEKQGKQQAQKAYQKVIREYADQLEVAAEARNRLDALEQAVSLARPKALLVRKVQADSTVSGGGAISPDGRYISYADGGTGDLRVYDQDSGKKRHLTDNGTGEEYAEESRWSPDSKQIVYTWYNKKGYYELRVIALDGSKPRIIYGNAEAEKEKYVEPFGWFPDGRQILAVVYKNDGTSQIVTVSCTDGSIGVLKTPGRLGTTGYSHISLSPDGRYIAYDSPPKEASSEASSNHDIFLLAVDGSSEIPLVEHPAHDYVLGWAPDGKRILFASDRSGTWDAFLIKIADGKPQGAPELVKTNIGPVEPLGFTRKGSFYYCLKESYNDIYTAELDPQTGKILGPAKKAIERYEGYNTYGDYSPDGKYLAYVSKRGLACLGNVYIRTGNVLCVRSLETGKDREIFPKGLESFCWPCWSPDSRFIFVVSEPDNRRGIYRIDTQTGEVTLVVILEQNVPPWPQCSRDGKAIFLVRRDSTKDYWQILARDLESGLEKEIYRAPSGEIIAMPSRSPDGQWLTFSTNSINKTSQKYTSSLKVIPVTGGEPRELYKGVHLWSRTWTADGKFILFCSQPDSESDGESYKWDLRRVSAAGGEPQKIGINGMFWYLSAHPDGRQIAISRTSTAIYSGGIWAMENFLP
ncbi:MAG TPA: tetratricopeptide repeat protein [archaeon]|nr:tetratricopeptide repeat protein [archaeon]